MRTDSTEEGIRMAKAPSTARERDRNVTYMRIVDDVTGSVITQGELANAVGASVRTVQNWTAGGTTPRGSAAHRLLDVQHIVHQLREVYTDEGVQIWLRSRNRNLGGHRPIELLADDQVDAVLGEVERVLGGM
jgi:DNA-binding transcriptional regulator YiaG